MTPEQKIKRDIILLYANDEAKSLIGDGVTEETVNDQYDALSNVVEIQDTEDEFRCGQVETNIPPETSRHYEARSVARKMTDGSWIGWTYWFGGGKHGEPESIPWMENAYELDCTETEQVVTVRDFKKKVG